MMATKNKNHGVQLVKIPSEDRSRAPVHEIPAPEVAKPGRIIPRRPGRIIGTYKDYELVGVDVDELRIPNVQDRYKDVPRFTEAGVSRTNWDDTMMFGRPGILLQGINIEKTAIIGSAFLKSLTTGISEEVIGCMLFLSWNLLHVQSPTRIFPVIDPTRTEQDIPYHKLPNDIIGASANVALQIPEGLSVIEKAKASTYVAASMLRLVVKSPENYNNAWDRIKASYKLFYNEEFPLLSLSIDKEILNTIKFQFAQNPVYRNSLTGILYLHENIKGSIGLRRFLYEQHLACSGMHCLNLMARICGCFNAPMDVFLAALCRFNTQDALDEIARITEMAANRENKPEWNAQTWKYARIFDGEYFMHVQTKQCAELVCILAQLSKICGAEAKTDGDVLNIAVLNSIPPSTKEYYRAVADKIFMEVKKFKIKKRTRTLRE